MEKAGEHLDPTLEISLETVKRRTVTGVLALFGRNFFLQAVSFLGFFFLSIFLEKPEYGAFILVSALINFFAYFSDIGLAAALVQKKEAPTKEELRTTFTVQQGLVFLLIVAVFLATPFLKRLYGLDQTAVFLLWALALSLLFSSLKTIPSVLLERKIEFGKLVVPQIMETVIFNLLAVYLAWKGLGVTSLSWAVLARGVSGLILIYIIQPWMPGFGMARDSLRGLLKYGIPYQANTFLAVAKDDGLTVLLGGILGTSGIGLLGWAQRVALAPLRVFMDVVIKVTFPAYARMQDSKAELSGAVSKSLFFISLLVFPSIVGLVLLVPLLTEIVPRWGKWQPALLALGLFAVNGGFAAVTTPLTNLLNAIGRITTTFRLMVMWTVLTWLLIPVLALKFGVNGAALGSALVGASSVVAWMIVGRYVKLNLFESAGKPLIAALLMGTVVWFLRGMLPTGLGWLLLLVLAGVSSYGVVIYLLVGPTIITDSRKVFYELKNR